MTREARVKHRMTVGFWRAGLQRCGHAWEEVARAVEVGFGSLHDKRWSCGMGRVEERQREIPAGLRCKSRVHGGEKEAGVDESLRNGDSIERGLLVDFCAVVGKSRRLLGSVEEQTEESHFLCAQSCKVKTLGNQFIRDRWGSG